jgi:2,3-diketo-5-methylthio-1-phosphopentane phosphatase
MGPAVGLVDGMRIGPDVAPFWEAEGTIPGLEPVAPSTRSAIRSIVHRAWMHRRLWLNDPDCLMARREDTKLTAAEARCLADVIAATGGMVLFSDDVPKLGSDSRALIRECASRAEAVDAADSRGVARVADLLATEDPGRLVTARGVDATLCEVDLAKRRSEIRSGPRARKLAVFCDFDGTFLIQDVGSTLARAHLSERRDELWRRYESGELTPWEYNLELLQGFELPESELEDFLASAELDPGSKALVAWCREQGVPFQVLSDGFDRNLDALQRLHGVEFDYRANRLVYRDGRWSIAAGHPDPTCGCGTGTCKGGIIRRFREREPDALCVHIGNGRVSDLCGARAADLTFARDGEKDTLAPALLEEGEPFFSFRTLHDVVEALSAIHAGRRAARRPTQDGSADDAKIQRSGIAANLRRP